MSQKYDAFVSYNFEDLDAAEKLAALLRNAGLRIWFEKETDHPGDSWFYQTAKALDASRALLVLVGQQGIFQPWPQKEILSPIEIRARQNDFHIIPVLLPGSEPTSLPYFLRTVMYCDLRKWDSKIISNLIEALRPTPKVFLCHAHEDRQQVENLYNSLKQDRLEPWFDKENLVVGNMWKDEIFQAIEQTDFFAICLSQIAITKTGFINNEIRTAVNEYQKRPYGTIFLLPIRLNDCEIPRIRLDSTTLLSDLQWIDIFRDDNKAATRLSEGIWKHWKKIKHV